MPQGWDPRQAGKYFALAQVGIEMAALVGLGLWLDNSYGWAPWGVAGGAVLGLVVGLTHLVMISNRLNESDKKPPPGDETR